MLFYQVWKTSCLSPAAGGVVSWPWLSLRSLHLAISLGWGGNADIGDSLSFPHPFFAFRSPPGTQIHLSDWAAVLGKGRGGTAAWFPGGLHYSSKGLYPGNSLPLPETRTYSWDFGKLRRSYSKERATGKRGVGYGAVGELCYFEQAISALASADTGPGKSSEWSHPAAPFPVPTEKREREQDQDGERLARTLAGAIPQLLRQEEESTL